MLQTTVCHPAAKTASVFLANIMMTVNTANSETLSGCGLPTLYPTMQTTRHG